MKVQFSFLVVFLLLLALVSCDQKEFQDLSYPEKVKSIERFFRLYFRYSARIKSIAEYNQSEKVLALLQFLEIHDELLELLSSADDGIERSSIEIILRYLDKNLQKSVLMKKDAPLVEIKAWSVFLF